MSIFVNPKTKNQQIIPKELNIQEFIIYQKIANDAQQLQKKENDVHV